MSDIAYDDGNLPVEERRRLLGEALCRKMVDLGRGRFSPDDSIPIIRCIMLHPHYSTDPSRLVELMRDDDLFLAQVNTAVDIFPQHLFVPVTSKFNSGNVPAAVDRTTWPLASMRSVPFGVGARSRISSTGLPVHDTLRLSS